MAALAALAAACAIAACVGGRPPRPASVPGTAEAAPGPVVLISLDGFRHDYLDWYDTPRLDALFAKGAVADGLTPVFPSKTFPNHWTIVTGLYADHHGIVANRMVDFDTGERFAMGDPSEFEPKWWGGEPVWLTAQRQGRLSATMFWPGAQVEIRGQRPTQWRPFDDELPNRDRVEQVVHWLTMPPETPPETLPSVVTLYFSDVDTAGHRYGPRSEETRAAVGRVDEAVGMLADEMARLGLLERSHMVIVSDHGMAATAPDRIVYLDDYVDLATVEVIDWSPVLALRARDGDHEAAYRALAGRHPALAIYRRADLPARLHYQDGSRIAPIIGIAAEGWYTTSRSRPRWASRGDHGYDNALPSMSGIFLARGPRIERGRLPVVENVHVYALLCNLAGIEPAPNDGSLSPWRPILRRAAVAAGR